MKVSGLVALAFASVAYGHTIFQKISVNGADQGQLKAIRAPTSNYPIQDVTDPDLACNKNIQFKDGNIINIPAGSRVGAWWGHIIGGAQVPNDTDNPIAPSHKGPVTVYLSKVDDAVSTGTNGLKWFKIAEDGLDTSNGLWGVDHMIQNDGPVTVYLSKVDDAVSTGTNGLKWFKIAEDGLDTSNGLWGVDHMIQNDGWQYFDMPTCVAPGQYLMRVELLALHSAYAAGGAQFYVECAQINVTGTGTNTGTDLVTFPGAYSANDPGILISIYDAKGVPNNSLKPYSIPGPKVLQC
ncbi:hypothetical protein CVT24_000765 [Panaeolus cyanescens]|uniref:AA9 family lytic polysaccharide monooxygenase n=1 Tax=Panaeolus cyanescens TaxID=181874 RepID=A0A409YZ61_9AGAR|nr:hypothetical protein CVT24_000765 [Panaeolus cyanescens]